VAQLRQKLCRSKNLSKNKRAEIYLNNFVILLLFNRILGSVGYESRTCGINQRVVPHVRDSRSGRLAVCWPFYVLSLHYLFASANKYYVGHSVDPGKDLLSIILAFYKLYCEIPSWMLKAVFQCGTTKAEAMQIEKFVKKQKSRNLLEQLCDPSFIPTEYLAQLVRVPHLRD
jgi:putative endonuclease